MADVKKIVVKIGADTTELEKGINKSEKSIQSFGKQVKNIGSAIGVAFAVDRVIRFAAETVKLAAQAEGVRIAFSRIGSEKLLDDLTNATKGTVSQLELMRKAVHASNFNLPLNTLASLFEFATMRAQQTGQSVDYLVESIVLGIGRKSPLILDNLGISAVELRNKLDQAGHSAATVGQVAAAVGQIAKEALEEAGDFAITTGTKIERLDARWQDLKNTIGDGLIKAIFAAGDAIEVTFGGPQSAASVAARNLEGKLSDEISAWEALKKSFEGQEFVFKEGEFFGPESRFMSPHGEFKQSFLWNMAMSVAEIKEEAPKAAAAIKLMGDAWMGTPFNTGIDYGAARRGAEAGQRADATGILDALTAVPPAVDDADDSIKSLDQTMVAVAHSFVNLGGAIGAALSGAAGAMEELAMSIVNNIGSLMMALGMMTANPALFLAGAAIQVGSAVYAGMKGSSQQATRQGYSVDFKISGDNLRGTLERSQYTQNLNT